MFKLNRHRTYRYPVSVTVFEGEKEQTGKFHAIFRAGQTEEMRARADEPMLDLVLVGVEGIEIEGEDGTPLAGEALLSAVKSDPAVSTALLTAYQESILRKNQRKT